MMTCLFSVSCQGAQGPPGGVGAMGGVGEKVRHTVCLSKDALWPP